jgi:hypothetical protein
MSLKSNMDRLGRLGTSQDSRPYLDRLDCPQLCKTERAYAMLHISGRVYGGLGRESGRALTLLGG